MRLAHSFAMESPQITADCVEATEFPDLAGLYRVFAVPKTVINRENSFEGGLPEDFFLEKVLEALPPPADAAPPDES